MTEPGIIVEVPHDMDIVVEVTWGEHSTVLKPGWAATVGLPATVKLLADNRPEKEAA
jgi:hypothetical protein